MAKRPDIDLDALLIDALPKPPGYRCTVCTALERIADEAIRERVRGAINDRNTYTALGLVRVLNALGQRTSRSSMERHRRDGHG